MLTALSGTGAAIGGGLPAFLLELAVSTGLLVHEDSKRDRA
jgi:hypothetical protein